MVKVNTSNPEKECTAQATNNFTKYRRCRNKTVNYLRSAKQAYFGKLNPRKPKEFRKACKLLSKTSSSIPVLCNNTTAYTNADKAELLNTLYLVSIDHMLHWMNVTFSQLLARIVFSTIYYMMLTLCSSS